MPAAATLAMGLFLQYTAWQGEYAPAVQRGVPLLLAAVLIFLNPRPERRTSWLRTVLDGLFLLGALGSIGYSVVSYEEVAARAGIQTTADLVASGFGLVVVLEMCRRTTGPTLPLLGLLALAYALWGKSIPGSFGHPGYDLERVLGLVWLGQEGVWGVALGIMASYVTLYIIFGAFLERSGCGRLFVDLAFLPARRLRSGPGLSAVVASGLFGTISGSGVADVATVGTFTIPLMKQSGYSARFAAAIQGLASIGAQIMPPVMGAAAFLMAEITGTPYLTIAALAVVPAMLYYLCVVAAVHLESLRLGLRAAPPAAGASFATLMVESAALFVPVGLLVYLLANAYSPARSVLVATVATYAVSLVRRRSRMPLAAVLDAYVAGVRGSLALWAACATVGIIIGMISLTGLGNKFAELVLQLAHASLLLALLLTAVASIVLGTALPTVPSYLLLAIVAAPSLVKLGVPLLIAHMFILYYGVTSDLTPPTALAPFTAAGLAGTDPWRTTWTVMRIGLPVFVVPFALVYDRALMLEGPTAVIAGHVLLVALGVIAFSAAATGFFVRPTTIVDRLGLTLAAAALIFPDAYARAAGLAAMAAVVARQTRGWRARPG